MGLRDLSVLVMVYASIPLALVRPFWGLIVFSWLAYMRPQDIAWAISQQRLSYLVALALLSGLAIAVARRRERLLTLRLQTVLLLALGVWFVITAMTAVETNIGFRWAQLFAKIILISVITTGLVRTRERFEAIILVIAFSLGLLGVKCGLFGVLHGGVQLYQGPGGFMADNNHFALAINMAIPLLVGIAMVQRQKLIRLAAVAMVPFCIMTIFFTFSRGGLVTFAVVTILLVLFSRHRLLAVALVGLSIVSFVVVSSDEILDTYKARAETIRTYEEDTSASNRLRAWEISWWVFNDHPIFGVGPYNFQAVFEDYGGADEKSRVAHNSFLQLLAENGLPAFTLFVALIMVTLWRLERIWLTGEPYWARIYARMMQFSILAYITGGMLLNMAYFDLFYHLVALSVSLEVAVETERGPAWAAARAIHKKDDRWWAQPSTARV